MNNKNNLEGIENQNLMNFQRDLLIQIQRTHRFFLGEIIALLVFSIMVGVFLVSFITYGVNQFYVVPRVIIAFNFSIFSVIQIIRIWPYLHEANFYLKALSGIIPNDNKKKDTTFQFIQGINAYLNKLYYLIFQRRKSKKKFQEYTSHRLDKELEKRLNLVMIGYGTMGILVIGYCVYLLSDFSFLLPHPIIYLSFLGIIISYSLILITTLKTRQIISQWMSGYFNLKSWADSLEKMPLKNKPNQINGE